MKLTNAHVFDPIQGFITRDLCINGPSIAAQSGEEAIDLSGCWLIPGLTDIHFHGCKGADFSDGDPEGLRTIARYQLSRGVTQICPAGMTLDVPQLEAICRMAAAHPNDAEDGAELAGIHLEGPFLSAPKKGAQNGAWLRAPDADLLAHLQEASGGLVKLVSLAPELPGSMEFIRQARELGVRVSLAHTTANYDIAMEAFTAGASQVTHLFNAMNPFGHRDPGPVGAAVDADCMVELISDGVHIHPAVVRSVFKLFGPHRVILVSDTVRAAGMSDGQYTLGGQDIIVKGKLATLTDGVIAGSVTDLMSCLLTAVSFGIPLWDAVTAAAVNPARAIGIYDRVGSLDVDKLANVVVLAPDLSLKAVIFKGRVTAGQL